MNAFAPLLALAVAQATPAEPADAPAAAPSPSVVTTTARPARRAPRPDLSPAGVSSTARSAPTPSPTAVSTTARSRTPSTAATPSATPTSTSTAPSPRTAARPLPEREDAERVAGAFLAALAARDVDGLAAAAPERFSFDGDPQTGRDAIRRTWRSILAGRDGPPPQVGTIEILPAADAVARFGKPPARIAPLARPGVLVAVASVGRRTVVLFLAKEGGRMAVLGMHD